MNKKSERAVSPVIGVILMVAITVILASVVGFFVLDSGRDAQPVETPDVSFGYAYDGEGTLTIRHTGGETLDGDSITIKADGVQTAAQFASEQVTAGDSLDVSVTSGDRVVVLYEQDGNSRILSQYEVP